MFRLAPTHKKTIILILAISLICCNSMASARTRKIKVSNAELKRQGMKKPMKMYTQGNVELLAKLIMAENGHAKHDETLWLTGVVVLNRVKSKQYPNTIRGVIYQRGQYSTAKKTWECKTVNKGVGDSKRTVDTGSWRLSKESSVSVYVSARKENVQGD